MKNLQIRGFGRIGNGIIQLKNVIQIALFYKYNIILPNHPFLNTTYITVNTEVTIEHEKIVDPSNFFYSSKIKDIDINLFKLNIIESCNIIRKIFIFKKETPLGDNDLLIHIRGEDIFSTSNVHPKYICPPLSFYVKIIESKKFDSIYLMSTDRLNPCVDKLITLYPKIKFKIQSLEDDIKLLLRFKNIIVSVGTFIPSLLILSYAIEKIYIPSYCSKDLFPKEIFKEKTEYVDLSEYEKLMFPWKNTAEQRDIMINYKLI
jgi:hypothetical protein